MKLFCSALVVILLVLVASPANSRTWYVKVDGSGDAPTIQAAIDSATTGDDVLVAAGTYNCGNQGSCQVTTGMIRMKSGIWLHSESGPVETILDPSDLGGRVIYCENVAAGAVIEGFTIRGGSMDGFPGVGGGGIRCVNSDLEIVGNVIADNVTSDVFGGSGYGGGIELAGTGGEIRGNTFMRNDGVSGAAISCGASSSPVISQNIITGSLGGVALVCDGGSAPTVTCNDFWDNEGGDATCTLGADNVFADPMFCDAPADDYSLHEDSPCATDNSPAGCGLIGALSVGCWGAPLSPVVLVLLLVCIGTLGVLRLMRGRIGYRVERE